MKNFDLDFQFGTNVLPESDGENIIKYKNGYVYKEIFLPLNYQDTIGKMLIKTKFTEDIAKILQKVTNINDFIYNNAIASKEPFIVPTYDLVISAKYNMDTLENEVYSAFSTSFKFEKLVDSLSSFTGIIKTTSFKDLDVAARDSISEEVCFKSLSSFNHDLPTESLNEEKTQESLKTFIKLVNTYLKTLKNVTDKDFYYEVVLTDPNPFQFSNIINGRKVRFIKDTIIKLTSERTKLRKEVVSETNKAKLVEVQTNYKKFIEKLTELNPVAKTTPVRKTSVRSQKAPVKNK